ncbi:peptidoglycan DD-metalloendopeptidase family protein [Alkalibacillus aidingensis]|uniref:peptidoglycan DD-metalloendopeptidase family protein n=1 Tax=Alkalibacillus aidingensis TaxID=2747607 RepID=UPI001660D04D|nr:M23 family metallopeptidase [Alkalibacillus aidingensis]
MSKLFENIRDRLTISKKVLIPTIIGTGLVIGTVYADTMDENLSNVYHVYVDGKHVGTVKDQEEVENFIDQKANDAQSNYQDVDLVPSEEIDFVEEFVFSPDYDTEKVKDTLENTLTYEASAVEIKVNDELIGYVNDLDVANQAVNQVVQKYLPDSVDQEMNLLSEEPILEDGSTQEIGLLPMSIYDREMFQSEKSDQNEIQQQTIELNDGSLVLDVGFTENVTVEKTSVDPSQLLDVDQLVKLFERGTLTDRMHTIGENEVLGQVASQYDLSMDELLDLNPELEEDSVIQVGQEVNVTALTSYVDVTYTEEITEEESISYDTVTEQTDDLYKGESRVKQQGSDGKKRVTYEVTTKNDEVVEEKVIEEEVLEEPKDHIIEEGTKVISSRGTGDFAWPAVGGRISSHMGPRWGSYHRGIDIAGVSDRSILAADNGVVVSAGWGNNSYGNRVVIDHNNGYETLYAHLSSIDVSVGQTVRKGQKIGVMGSTGNSTGTHLHFEITKNGSLVNPVDYLR